jgi:uncharacterized membrane protein YbjE (DUF340 family)
MPLNWIVFRIFAKTDVMLPLILLIISGVLIGYLLRRIPQMQNIGTVLNLIIVLLLFFLGVSVGSNEDVLNNFSVIGFDALVLTVGGLLGTLLCAWWVYRTFFKKKNQPK